MRTIFDKLNKRKINSVTWTEDVLTFHTDTGDIKYNAMGDCCSSSYIEDLDSPEVFNDAVLNDFDVVDGDTKDDEDSGVTKKWTFYKFVTDKGMCTLSFRNDSNGYYNGWLEEA